ncbi:MAG: TolC family protein, partial [candidate division Zixibacteria bacterium]|nr:TolC family protein [candidate division Zixibacteria bacterium]
AAADGARPDTMVLTAAEVRRLALEYNRDYLQALEEVRAADAEVVKARAGALPDISGQAYYDRNFLIASNFVQMGDETVEFRFGFKNSFGAGISLRQPIYQGGKVFTAVSIAQQYRKYARAGAAEAAAEVAYTAEVLFYQVGLRESQVNVLRQALEAAELNADMVQKQFDQGMTSEFEVLRARVERNNLLPQLIASESEVELSRKRLKSFLGLDLSRPIRLEEPGADADTSLAGLGPEPAYVDTALARRPAMQQADLLVDIAKKAVKIAQADYWPNFEAVSSWGWSAVSDDFTLRENNSRSLTAGLMVSMPIFDGLRRSGQVTQAKVDHNQAALAASKIRDDIRLEVEQSYDALVQAKKALDIQGTNIAQAEEGLKIANVRYESGVGTLLEVLSAQVALTDARSARVQALFAFRVAQAKLKRASMIQPSME